MMDLLKHLNSSAVAEHLNRIDYPLSALESVWIVFESDSITLSEKLAALGHILMMPDEKRCSQEFPNGYSVHKAVRDYFEYLKNTFIEFTTQDDNYYYEVQVKNTIDGEWRPQYHYFSSCRVALEYLNKTFTMASVWEYEIRRCSMSTPKEMIRAQYRHGELVKLHRCWGDDPLQHLLMGRETIDIYHPPFPTPFRPGDILYDKMQHRMVVLDANDYSNDMPSYYFYSRKQNSVLAGYAQHATDLEYYQNMIPRSHWVLYNISRCIKNGESVVDEEGNVIIQPSSYSHT